MRQFYPLFLFLTFFAFSVLSFSLLFAQNTPKSGLVLSEKGEPMTDVQIFIDHLKPVLSNVDGKFEFQLPEGQNYPTRVKIKKLGWAITGWDYRPDENLLNIILAPSKTVLQGKVVDAQNNPIAGVKIGLQDAYIETKSNQNGQFSIIVPPGIKIQRADGFFLLNQRGLPKESVMLDAKGKNVVLRLVANQVFEVTFFSDKNRPLSGLNARISTRPYRSDVFGKVKITNQIVTKNDEVFIEGWQILGKKYDSKQQTLRLVLQKQQTNLTNPTTGIKPNNFESNNVFRTPVGINPNLHTNPTTIYPNANQINEMDSSYRSDIIPDILSGELDFSQITLEQYIKQSQVHFSQKEDAINQIEGFKELVKSQKDLSVKDKEQAKNYLAYLYQSLGEAEKHIQIRDKAQQLIEQLQNALIEKDETFTQAVIEMESAAAEREAAFQEAMERKEQEFRKQIIMYLSAILFLVFIAILLLILIRKNREQKKALEEKNQALEKSEHQLSMTNEELKQRNEQIGAQSEHQRRLNEEISRHNRNITAGIRYAQTIQSAILPAEEELKACFQEYFIIYKPKDIVSGDFYWIAQTNSKKFLAVVDCTGHGVPGAFMSMIGTNLLNTIVNNEQIYEPKEIIESLNQKVRIALKQEKKINDDGMDICFCVFEQTTNNQEVKMIFTGAKRPLYYFEQNKNTLQTLKGDNKSVGGRQRPNKYFTNQEVILRQGDMVYLTTDGLIDQNNSKHRKFGSRKLTQLLSNHANRPIAIQQEIIEETLKQYQQVEAQRDDITVIGVQL